MAGDAAFNSSESFVVDPLTATILNRNKTESIILFGKNLSQLKKAVGGENFIGTRVTTL